MTPRQIVEASRHIGELSVVKLPYAAARSLMRLRKAIKEEFGAVCEYERSLLESFGGKKQKDGGYEFPDTEQAEAAAAAHLKFMEEDNADIKLPRVDLSGYTNQIQVSAVAMEALDGIVMFEEDE